VLLDFIFIYKMDITPIQYEEVLPITSMGPQKIVSENDKVVGCDSSGKPVDKLGRTFTYDPCPFGQTYNCSSSSCKYSSWFLFISFGLPFLAIAILIIGASVMLRFTKEKRY
jgi:hypothetical protein